MIEMERMRMKERMIVGIVRPMRTEGLMIVGIVRPMRTEELMIIIGVMRVIPVARMRTIVIRIHGHGGAGQSL